MLYTGDPNDVCAITFTPVEDISHPVGFDANHAFECESIIHWLTEVRCTNPLNGQKIGPVPISTVLHPLMVGEVLDVRDLEHTIEMISSAGNAIDSERGNPLLPPTPWQKKIQTDLVLVIMHILIHSFIMNTSSWALINITDKKVTMLHHDLPELTTVVSLLCSLGYAFCANYPVKGFTIVVFIVILYFVNHCINVTSKSLPFISEGDTFTHHAHVLDILIVAAKFMLDFITIVMRKDIR